MTPSAIPRGMIETLRTGSAPGREHADQRVARLVVGGAAAVVLGQHEPRGAPSMILSSASVKSAFVTFSCPRRAASSAASLARLARSAPTMPGVEAASGRGRRRRRAAPSACGPRGSCGGRRVRRADDHAAVEAAGAQQRRVEDLGPVGGGEHDDARVGVEAVHLGEDLVERLLALVVAAEPRRRRARAADRVELVDEDDRGRASLACLKRSRTREAPTPTIASTNSDAEIEKNGTLGLPGDRAGEQRLAGAGLAGEQHAARDAAAEPAVAVGVAQEVDDLGELGLGLLDAGDVLEGHRRGRRLDAPGAGAAEAPSPPARRRRRAAAHLDEQPDEQDHRAEADRIGSSMPRPALIGSAEISTLWSWSSFDELVVVGERRDLRLEVLRRLGVLVAAGT